MGVSNRCRRHIPVIGITGQIGAGKSVVAGLFAAWGGVVISGDRLGHEVIARSARLRRRLVDVFGTDVLRRGQIDRTRLAQRAFATAEGTCRLNALVHPLLLRELARQIRLAAGRPETKAVVIDAALLPEWGRERVAWDKLIGVWAPLALRHDRLKRRGWDDHQIRLRSRRQLAWRQRRALCDCVVKNDGSRALLRRRARLCWEKIVP
ncbi:MAG: dephospho-CoA kinase [Candidatus Zixiibacteriota bacterium]